MNRERWQRIKTVFDVASRLDAESRGRYLAQACGSDHELRTEIESLLVAHDAGSLPLLDIGVESATRVMRDPFEVERRMREQLERALEGEYEIIRPLGAGGMGAVYLARNVALDLLVAIKVLRPELAPFDESRQRFQREARTAAALRHPNIVRLYQYKVVGDLWCFVMDHVAGGSLDRRLRIEGAIPCNETRDILVELAGALEKAHRHGVIHRDIKPANILFDEDGRPMLADFGIAKVGGLDTLTPANQIRGTPWYMSPEQLQGRSDVDARSDLYSLGLVAHAMLVGHEPNGASMEEIIARRLSEDPVPIATAAPACPPGLANVVMRCLARDPAARFPSARALKEALERADRALTIELPETVRDIPGFGQWSLVWASFWTTYAFLGNHRERERVLTLIVAGLVPLGFALHMWNVSRHGLRRVDVARITYWPPEWWGMWWPPLLRRPGDLWARLPWQARAVRIVLSLFFVGMPALILTQSMLAQRSIWISAGEYILLFAAAEATAAGVWWTRKRGVPPGEAARVLFGATMPTPAWRSSTVARLLAPAGGVRPPLPGDSRDYQRAIDELVALLPPEQRRLGRRSTAVAHRILAAVQRYDREIADLDKESSPVEIEKLVDQLTGLGPTAEHEPPTRTALREAVGHQLSQLRMLRRDAELAAHHRDEVLDLMRSLWAHLRRLHEDSTGGQGDASRAAEALRWLCEEIIRLLDESFHDPADPHNGRRPALGRADDDPEDDPGSSSPIGSLGSPPRSPYVHGSSPLGP